MNDMGVIERYKHDLQTYSLEQMRYIPEPGSWSLGQMYSHVILVGMEYLDNVEACSQAKEEQPLGKTKGGEQLFARGGFPPIKIKLPDVPENTPSNTESKEDLAAGLDRVQQRLMEWCEKVGEVNPRAKVEHGGFGWLNAREWFDLVEMHFRHHGRQKQELEQRLGL
ncbi:DinB family protein [Brevibacillus fluminis]|uniref:DinB family protein n=1 Tax=Brevibacillus fluminis TaxID=511487 RepID=A0A3M8CWH1_9BACL|nr:DinB family protein [Brevibacillus fluminis]RNB80150.1 DinB family protein [Brevibacillus fluminis]